MLVAPSIESGKRQFGIVLDRPAGGQTVAVILGVQRHRAVAVASGQAADARRIVACLGIGMARTCRMGELKLSLLTWHGECNTTTDSHRFRCEAFEFAVALRVVFEKFQPMFGVEVALTSVECRIIEHRAIPCSTHSPLRTVICQRVRRFHQFGLYRNDRLMVERYAIKILVHLRHLVDSVQQHFETLDGSLAQVVCVLVEQTHLYDQTVAGRRHATRMHFLQRFPMDESGGVHLFAAEFPRRRCVRGIVGRYRFRRKSGCRDCRCPMGSRFQWTIVDERWEFVSQSPFRIHFGIVE